MIFFTSICANYLSKALVLARSLKKHNSNVKFILCLVEDEILNGMDNYDLTNFDDIVLAKDLGINEFNSFIFKHDIVEASTAVKGHMFKYLLNKYPKEDKFVYLDPDIKVYDRFYELEELLEIEEIVLTPHLSEPEVNNDIQNVYQNEISCLRHGVFNLGFLAIKRGVESVKFINWWSSRLEMFCYEFYPDGIFTDQKWIDLAPAFFNVHILRHPGYNFAIWNYSKREISVRDGKYYVNNMPLRFIHFSSIDSGLNEIVTRKYYGNSEHPIYSILNSYKKEIENSEVLKWSYGFYISGEKISKESRKSYRSNLSIQRLYSNPFKYSNDDININQYIPHESWDKYKQTILNNDPKKKMLLDNIESNLGYLLFLAKKNGEMKYLLWGASEGGKLVRGILEEFVPKIRIIGYVDSIKTGDVNGIPIYTPNHIESINHEYLIVGTTTGAKDVINHMNKIGKKKGTDYLLIFENSSF